MAFSAIDSNQIESGDAVTQELWSTTKDNFDAHETRLQSVEVSLAVSTIVGEVKMYCASTAPVGWLNCDGAAYSRTTYAALFAVLGTSFGVGDGATTFNIPDFRTRVPVGANAGGGGGLTARTIGQTYGAERQDHVHQWYNTSFADDVSYDLSGNEVVITGVAVAGNGIRTDGGTVGEPTISNAGLFTAKTDIITSQPSTVLNFIIKT